jgi:tetrahydromethanopterin S-methyltransferase subunit F
MDKEQALVRIETLIFEITSEYERGIAIGFISACFIANIISISEYKQFSDRALAE